MTENSRLRQLLQRSKDEGLILGIQLSSGSLNYGIVEELDNGVLLVRDKKGRKSLVTHSGIVSVFVAERGVSAWEK